MVPAAAPVSVIVTVPVAVPMVPVAFGTYCTLIVHVPPPAATTVPFKQVVPVVRIEKLPVLPAAPAVLATVGAAVNVSGPVPLLVTVIIPLFVLLVAGVETRGRVGPEKPTTALAVPPPVSVTGEPVTGTLAVMVTLPLDGPAAVGAEATLIVQLAPAGKVVPQLDAPGGNVPLVTRVNGPATLTPIPVAPAVPVLLSVRFWVALVVPVPTLPNARDVGATASIAVVVPAPVNSIAPASTEPFAFLLVPKKSKVGARV